MYNAIVAWSVSVITPQGQFHGRMIQCLRHSYPSSKRNYISGVQHRVTYDTLQLKRDSLKNQRRQSQLISTVISLDDNALVADLVRACIDNNKHTFVIDGEPNRGGKTLHLM